jgi:uncharacterized protein YpmB
MIHNIEQKHIIRLYIKISLDGDTESYYLVLDKNQQGQTINRWVETEDHLVFQSKTMLESLIEQFNKDTEKKN